MSHNDCQVCALQKYRSQRRHLQAKEAEAANWHSKRAADLVHPTLIAKECASSALFSQLPLGHHSYMPAAQPLKSSMAIGSPVACATPFGLPFTPMGMAMAPVLTDQWAHQLQARMTQVGNGMGMEMGMTVPLHVWGRPAAVEPCWPLLMGQPHFTPFQFSMQQPWPWQSPDGSMAHHPMAPVSPWAHYSHPISFARSPCTEYSSMPPMAYTFPSVAGAPADGATAECEQTAMNAVAAAPEAPCQAGKEEASPHFGHGTPNVKDILEAAILETLSNPNVPLPLGLKPPSMDSIIMELESQGFSCISKKDDVVLPVN
eukprot:TRINITY_DN5283_c0_g1_i3.p1 TRINITY_DN5283_c0_g1~~TRINITY_DN5283_c0_g1_i3.p1  ORF type:complete len:316 (-),score=38.02 TRINITY_DN5283_c0_g1_i3:516-1463(-)